MLWSPAFQSPPLSAPLLKRVGCWLMCWVLMPWGALAQAPAPAPSNLAVWTGWVSWVMDGDTVLLVRPGHSEPVKLRIDAIDAPETCQAGGLAARDAMVTLALRKSAQVQLRGQDSYGRAVGRLSVDGVDLGGEMVRMGMAWAYRYRTGRGPYAALQRQAQKEKKGVFAGDEAPMSPALFRQFNGSCHAP